MALTTAQHNAEFLDSIISRLWTGNITNTLGHLTAIEINQLVRMAVESFMQQETMLTIQPPITVMGDIHGQFRDLLALLSEGGLPPTARYLFLGDYVDRGTKSIEVICLLLAFKVRHPNDVYLLRGNHESRCINRTYGFYRECIQRYSIQVWHAFQETFNAMPICALVGGHVFCAHGGLPRYLKSLDEIRQIRRPLDVPDEGLVCDLMWSDPNKTTKGWEDNTERGASYMFGEDAVEEFCKRFDVDLVVRAHQVFDEGFELFADGHLITIFSAPNYAGTYRNAAAMLHIDSNMVCRVKVLQPQDTPASDDVASEEEVTPGVQGASGSGGKSSPLWMRRSLNQLQQLFEANGYSLYHPGQPDPPRRWWRTTMKAGESHLSYRNASEVTAPIEMSVVVQGAPDALNFKAHVEGNASMFEYIMYPKKEYEMQTVAVLDEIVRKELYHSFLKPVLDATKAVPQQSTSGLKNTINWFSSWLSSGSSSE